MDSLATSVLQKGLTVTLTFPEQNHQTTSVLKRYVKKKILPQNISTTLKIFNSVLALCNDTTPDSTFHYHTPLLGALGIFSSQFLCYNSINLAADLTSMLKTAGGIILIKPTQTDCVLHL